MSEKLSEIKQFLQNSGFYDTLLAFEKEAKSSKHPNDPFLNFTFDKTKRPGQYRPIDSFGEHDFSTKFNTEPTNAHHIQNAKMQFESPYNDTKFKNSPFEMERNVPQVSQSFTRSPNERDMMTNDDNFSFGEENISDNEFQTGKAKTPTKLQDDINKFTARAKSDNFINLNKVDGYSNNANVQRRAQGSGGGQASQGNNPYFDIVEGRVHNQFAEDEKYHHMNSNTSNDVFGNSFLYRPRSIRSRQNSLDKESVNSGNQYDRYLNMDYQVNITSQDSCNIIRYRGLLVPSEPKPEIN